MKLLIDVSVGQTAENRLKQLPHEALTVREIDPRIEDHAILALAVQEERLVITMDKDFGEWVFQWEQPHYDVLLL